MIDKLYYDEIVNIGKVGFRNQLSMLNCRNIDLFLLPEKSIKGSLLFLLVKATFKLGYLSSYFLKANFKIGYFPFIPHQQHYYLKSYHLIEALQLPLVDDKLIYQPDLSFIEIKSTPTQPEYILFVPSVSWVNRAISFEDAKVITETVLKSRFFLFLSGGQESLAANLELIKIFTEYKDKIMFFEKSNLLDLVGHIKNSKGVICGDGGPMGIAFGFQKPVLSFWGPTIPVHRKPEVENINTVNIYEKQNCKVINCWNMEHKPFCKTCLRLENIPDLAPKLKSFLLKIK